VLVPAAYSGANAPKPAKLTSVNESLMSQHHLGAVEEITFDSFDGRNIQGWIIKPPDFDPTKNTGRGPFIGKRTAAG
jgi:dipeptidyl aminopeptidase/acylaminoacyl peptidase